MKQKRSFASYAIAFCILGVIFNFFYSGLQNDQINIIQGYSAWGNQATLMPITIGNLVCILLTFVFGTCFIKFGVRKTLIPCILISALGCLGIAAANGIASVSGVEIASQAINSTEVQGNYPLYAASLFIVRCSCMCFQMAGFQLAASWFIRYRGRVLGIITIGSPLFSVIGTSVMNSFIATHFNGDYRPFYVGVCVILVVIAILSGLLLRDYPEDVGLYPDGADHAPISEANEEEVQLSVKEVLTQKKTWILFVSFGIYQMIIGMCMASMVVWFTHLCMANQEVVAAGPLAGLFEAMGPMTLFLGQAAKWLSVGAILGIPMSFVFGVVDDKLGTPVASMMLGLTELLPVLGLMMQKQAVSSTGACNVTWLIIWGFGVACMTGGVPTMHPASISFAFGRKEYQAANRVIMAMQLIPAAFGATIMVALINSANDMSGWYLCIALIVIALIFTLPMFKMKDANAEDRG
ncbi:MAG: MFS transporter [Eubacterium sp.]|nr:MFS transporter [Eubacterium sp.]